MGPKFAKMERKTLDSEPGVWCGIKTEAERSGNRGGDSGRCWGSGAAERGSGFTHETPQNPQQSGLGAPGVARVRH